MYLELAKNIQVKINESNVGISEFERSAGLKRSAVANIISGKSKNPTIEVIMSIAKKLDCKVEDLLEQNMTTVNDFKSIRVNPKTQTEIDIFFEIIETIVKQMKKQKIKPAFDPFFKCIEEAFFYAIHGRYGRIKEDDFLLWIINSYFYSEKADKQDKYV